LNPNKYWSSLNSLFSNRNSELNDEFALEILEGIKYLLGKAFRIEKLN
jgi:hypothetical protein